MQQLADPQARVQLPARHQIVRRRKRGEQLPRLIASKWARQALELTKHEDAALVRFPEAPATAAPKIPHRADFGCVGHQGGLGKPAVAHGPSVETKYAANPVVDRSGAECSAGVSAQPLEHMVPISDQIAYINFLPANASPLERIEPVDENLCVSPYRLARIRPLHSVFVQEGNCRLDELHIRTEEQRKTFGSWLPKCHAKSCLRCIAHRGRHFYRLRQLPLVNDLHHRAAPPCHMV